MTVVFSGRGATVVTGRTGTQYLAVIHCIGGSPGDAVMTVLTDVGGLNMRRALANRLDAVVTAHAVPGDIRVIKVGRDPANGSVAVVAPVA